MKISNSKKELARIISENGGWRDDAKWSVQHKTDGRVVFTKSKYKPEFSYGCWDGFGTFYGGFVTQKALPNWHQTILSREEYFHLYPVPDADGWIEWNGGECPVGEEQLVRIKVRGETGTARGKAGHWSWEHSGCGSDIIAYMVHKPEQAKPEFCESATRSITEPESKPTIESLAADYRNKLDYANRKQDEADKAKAESSAALSELEKAIAAIGFAITPICAVVQEHTTPNWRNWVKGDEIKCKKTPPGAVKSIGLTGYVSKVYDDCVEVVFEHHIAVAFGSLIDECFEFVNRPAK